MTYFYTFMSKTSGKIFNAGYGEDVDEAWEQAQKCIGYDPDDEEFPLDDDTVWDEHTKECAEQLYVSYREYLRDLQREINKHSHEGAIR